MPFSELLCSSTAAVNGDEIPHGGDPVAGFASPHGTDRGLHGHIGGKHEANGRGAAWSGRRRVRVRVRGAGGGHGRGTGGGVEGIGRSGHGRAGGRSAVASRPPVPPSPVPYRVPQPAVGQNCATDASEYTGNNSMSSGELHLSLFRNEQEIDIDDVNSSPEASEYTGNNSMSSGEQEIDADDVQGHDASVSFYKLFISFLSIV
jgi:hypothetical protein